MKSAKLNDRFLIEEGLNEDEVQPGEENFAWEEMHLDGDDYPQKQKDHDFRDPRIETEV